MTNPILITGASGYVGQATFQEAVRAGYPVVGAYHRQQPALAGGAWMPLDLRDAAGVARLITDLRPAAIIHAGAAWGTPDEAQATIVDGTRAVVSAASRVGARLIHLSTDVLFDGEHAPYRESDPPAPITFYGAAKAAAEGIVAAYPSHVIVRTSLVTCFDPPDRSTAMVLRALLEPSGEETSERENGRLGERALKLPLAPTPPLSPARPVTLFTDEYRSPVRTEDLAAALVELIDHDYRACCTWRGRSVSAATSWGCASRRITAATHRRESWRGPLPAAA